MSGATLTVHFQKRFGAFDRIISILRRRGFPISGITQERTHQGDIGRMTVALEGDGTVEQVRRHLEKLPDVLTVNVQADGDGVKREYALLRVHCESAQEGTIQTVLARHSARTVGTAPGELVVEASGTGTALDALFADLAPFGIEESARTNPIALNYARSSGDDRAI